MEEKNIFIIKKDEKKVLVRKIKLKNNSTKNKKETWYKKTFKLLKSIGKWFINTIVVVIATAWIADMLVEKTIKKINEEEVIEKQLSTLENMYIGCSKDWIDENIGTPTFEYNENFKVNYKQGNDESKEIYYDYLGCVYITDIGILRTFFDKDDMSCKAFFITAVDDKYTVKLPKRYRHFVNDKSLGNFSYYDIQATPEYINGFFSNGTGRYLCEETYYFFGNGNYYYYFFATLDYGLKLENDLTLKDDIIIDDEMKNAHPRREGMLKIKDRENSFPNTYGVADRNIGIDAGYILLSDYEGFDSFQLKNAPYEWPEFFSKAE